MSVLIKVENTSDSFGVSVHQMERHACTHCGHVSEERRIDKHGLTPRDSTEIVLACGESVTLTALHDTGIPRATY